MDRLTLPPTGTKARATLGAALRGGLLLLALAGPVLADAGPLAHHPTIARPNEILPTGNEIVPTGNEILPTGAVLPRLLHQIG